MGVTALWQLLGAEQVVEHYRGASADELAHIVQAVDGAAVAVDLSPWLMQVGGSWAGWAVALHQD